MKAHAALRQYGAFNAYFASISPSNVIAVVVLPVLTSRPVEMPSTLGVKTPSGCPAPVPVKYPFSWVMPNL